MSEGKVVHISASLHVKLRKFCDKRGLKMAGFVEDIIEMGMEVVKEEEEDGKKSNHMLRVVDP